MQLRSTRSRRFLPAIILALTFALTLTARIQGISTHFWLLRDQIRDWEIALRPFSELPLIGPPTHVGGYTIGPAFYWMLWAIRVTVGPWFDNLPHAGGIGQAILQSAADALLLLAVWRRTQSLSLAVATITLLATASFDLALAPLVWNPVAGSTLAKIAIALLLLDWHRGSLARTAVTAAVAWSAVHAYTGAIYVAAATFIALLVDPLVRGDRKTAWRTAGVLAGVVLLLQLPYVAHQVSHQFRGSAMGAVTGSVGRILSGREWPRLGVSAAGYAGAFNFIQGMPWRIPLAWALIPCAILVAIRYRRDVLLLTMTILPQVMAIAGYAFFLAALDHYYYLSLMPAAVLTIVLAAAAVPTPRARQAVGIVLCAAAFAVMPARLRFAATLHRMPQYGALVQGSRTIAKRGQPMRAIETEFTLPRTASRTFVYQILGGRLDRTSPWVAVITSSGDVVYRRVEGS